MFKIVENKIGDFADLYLKIDAGETEIKILIDKVDVNDLHKECLKYLDKYDQ